MEEFTNKKREKFNHIKWKCEWPKIANTKLKDRQQTVFVVNIKLYS